MAGELTAREAGAIARPASWTDADAVAGTLGRAFLDDPLICFLLGDPATREAKMPRLFRLLFKLGLPHGACDETGGHEAVALWRPPNRWHIPFWQYITNGPEFARIFGVGRGPHVMGAMDHIERRHPREPHWYLQVIGTDPAKQGKGYGGVLMRHRLAQVDAAGAPSYLESSKASNIPIYQSFGFEVTGEINLPNGPTLYPMWRAARPAGA